MLLSAAGDTFRLPESQFNAAAALTGSGPAFAALIVDALADGAVLAGLPREKSIDMACLMLKGSMQLMLQRNQHPALLRDSVCSPGGTTIAGVRALERGGE